MTTPRPLQLYNTLSRQEEDFTPLEPGKVGIYSCGPTVYSYAHIGNMRAYIFADTLRRTLEVFGYRVNHVMNITDVGHLTSDADEGEDKMEVGGRREGLDAWAVAQKYTEAFFTHCAMLNILRPHTVCRATDHIAEQIRLIEALEKGGFTYTTEDGVYFNTEKFATYGQMARLDIRGLEAGHRVAEGGKRHKTDFALWKFSPAGAQRDMEWDSPWGKGFPGWHIECSAMSMRYLGQHFDIHTGGIDHIPVHHTNEIAQSEAATGESPFVNYWLHVNFLNLVGAEKMSKSKGHVFTVETLAEKGFLPLAYRYLCLNTHYRKEIQFSDTAMAAAQTAVERLAGQLEKLPPAGEIQSGNALAWREKFLAALGHDLNTPEALAALWGMLGDVAIPPAEKHALLLEFDDILGLNMPELPALLAAQAHAGVGEATRQKVEALIAEREEARKARDFTRADAIRAELEAMHIVLEDSASGTSWKQVKQP